MQQHLSLENQDLPPLIVPVKLCLGKANFKLTQTLHAQNEKKTQTDSDVEMQKYKIHSVVQVTITTAGRPGVSEKIHKTLTLLAAIGVCVCVCLPQAKTMSECTKYAN